MRLNDALHHAVSEDWCGNDAPPGSTTKLYVEEYGCGSKALIVSRDEVSYEEMTDERRKHLVYVFSGLNDGSEIGIGRPDEWFVILSKGVVLRLAWFTIWTWWIKGTWFGLKRAIYYSTLHKIVQRYKQEGNLDGTQ